MKSSRMQSKLVVPKEVQDVLSRKLKGRLMPLRRLQKAREIGKLELKPEAYERGKKRAKQYIDNIRSSRRKTVGADRAKNLDIWANRKNEIKKKIRSTRKREQMRTPDQVIEDLANRVKKLQKDRNVDEHATIIVRAIGTNQSGVLEKVAGLSGGTDLVQMGLEVQTLKVGKGLTQFYEIKLPIHKRRLGRELLNVAWALKKGGTFDTAWPGERKLWIFAGEPTHASRAPRTFAWNLDMMRGRQAHDIEPSLGEGVTVAHLDTGWAPHPEYNSEQIDIDRSYNAITGQIGGTAARHSIRLEDKDVPNISHGTATASLIVGGPPFNRLDLSNIPEEELQFDRGENPQVDDGHIIGISPNARIVPIKFISDSAIDYDNGRVSGVGVVRIGDEGFTEGIDYAVKIDADVMSLSVGGMVSNAVRDAFDDAILNHDLIVVAAAGQTYLDNILSVLSPEDSVVEPARFQHVIAVAGCSVDGRPWDESHQGPNVDITAPCDAVWIADFDKERADSASGDRLPILQAASGTSFSTAIMAGAAALWIAHHGGRSQLKSQYPDTPLAWVFREILQLTARPVFDGQWDASKFGPGIINLERMLQEALPPEDEIPEPPATVGNLLTEVEEGWVLLDEALGWMGDQYREAEATVRVGIAVAEAFMESALAEIEDTLAVGYAAAEEAIRTGTEWVNDAVEAGEQVAEDTVDALEDLGEAAADAGEEIVEDVVDFVEDVGEGIGEAADTFAGWFS